MGLGRGGEKDFLGEEIARDRATVRFVGFNANELGTAITGLDGIGMQRVLDRAL